MGIVSIMIDVILSNSDPRGECPCHQIRDYDMVGDVSSPDVA
jgi:hypothetical protein